MKEKKTNSTFKEKLLTKIPPLYAWLTVGVASAAVLIVQIILITKA
ncbi:MAG: hypothetical protein IJV87_00095 [Clostridia bacterium]|nr:hypothetical protein [Clostridia bacterium]